MPKPKPLPKDIRDTIFSSPVIFESYINDRLKTVLIGRTYEVHLNKHIQGIYKVTSAEFVYPDDLTIDLKRVGGLDGHMLFVRLQDMDEIMSHFKEITTND